ncbi:low molecular weight protein-tyrosine-phosphatase [Geothrix paludis]|uniref:low molecular weight protein-tyrosine-phosphatase n=1 Tax=Geothrix paludis TaxID=2922722 RepID=UPI001FABB24A|nr:low molecular weight protein-tyrosine-phosphatase [Geothrix paludis]
MKTGCTPAIHHILVICEGNHCRGPMAEAMLRAALPPDIQVASAGLNALEGLSVDPEVSRLMAEAGLDVSGHMGRQLTEEMLLAADLVLVMDLPQKAWCEKMTPSLLGRTFLLGHWRPEGTREIQDPFRQGSEAFRTACENIRLSVSDWLPRLAHEQRSA